MKILKSSLTEENHQLLIERQPRVEDLSVYRATCSKSTVTAFRVSSEFGGSFADEFFITKSIVINSQVCRFFS